MRTKGLLLIGVPCTALMLGTVSTMVAERRQIAARACVQHTVDVRLEIAAIFNALGEAESAVRGELVAQLPGLRERFRELQAQIPRQVAHLAATVANDRAQAARCAEIEQLAVQRLALLDHLLVPADQTPGARPVSIINSVREGVTVMQTLRHVLEEADQAEKTLMESRLATLGQAEFWMHLSTACTMILGVGGGLVALLLSNRTVVHRLARLEANAAVVARGEKLEPYPTGRDEVGRAEAALIRASELLAERQESVRAAIAKAEGADQAKGDFISHMSHELRTPLNAILGFSQLLAMEEPTPAQSEGLAQIEKAGRHLLDLINEILDLSRMEAGRMRISLEPVHTEELITESVQLVMPLARTRQIKIDVQSLCHDVHAQADRSRLRQILLNLLNNAVKYNRDGGAVTVTCHREESTGSVLIEVADTGYGIASSDLARVFDPFERLNAAEHTEGTGLGLTLARRMLELMQGTIQVQSTVGEGSVFSIRLPLAEAPVKAIGPQPIPMAAHQHASFRRSTILYIEDNLANLTLVQRIIRHRPHLRLISAMQGQLGWELARQHHPDIILLDLDLPDLPGREVLQRLKADRATRHIPVIVVSADATSGEIERLGAAGAAGYLTKPFMVDTFLKVLDEALQHAQDEAA